MAAETQTPQRMTIANLLTGKSITAQFNPDEVKEKIAVIFTRLAILGQSFQPLQYQGTENLKVSFDLGFDAMAPDGAKLMSTRAFMWSLCYPSRLASAAQTVIGGDTPKVLFVWPQLYSFQCKITGLSGTHKRFALAGASTSYALSVEIERVSDVRIYMEDILANGTQGSSGSGPKG